MLSFKRTSYNSNLFDIQLSEKLGPMFAVVRRFDRGANKIQLCVQLESVDRLRIQNVEREISSQFSNFSSALNEDQLSHITIPSQYGSILLKLKTIDNKPLLPEHIVDGVECVLTIQPKKVICMPDKTICSWLCESFCANIQYA